VEQVATDALERGEGVAPIERLLSVLEMTRWRERVGAGVSVRADHLVPRCISPAPVVDAPVPQRLRRVLTLTAKPGIDTAIATLVERRTRFTMLVQLPGRTAESLRVALTEHIQRLPDSLRRSLTWDQGKEMTEHARLTVDSNVQVYVCDPSRPWQRGTNENTSALLRRYFPKGDDRARYRQADLDRVADELNRRPRQTLNWMKPREAFDKLVAMTA
jgi:hypothetical protein